MLLEGDDTLVVLAVVVVEVDDDVDVVAVLAVEDVVVVLCDVVELVTVDVVVVAEQSRKFPLSLPFDPLPWLSSQFPCPPPLCTQGSPPYPGGHSGAVSVSPRRSLPACVLVVAVGGGVVGPATAIAASAPAPKTTAPSTTDKSAFFMRGLTASSIVEQSPPLSTEAKRLDCPDEGAVQRLNATAARGTCRTPRAARSCTPC